jgi:flagellar protein FlaF
MGFSTSGSMAIIFVGILVAVSTAYPVMEAADERVQTAVDDRADRSVSQRNSDIELVNASYDATNDTLVVLVTNTGSRTLSVNATDVLVDGAYQTGYATSVDGTTSRRTWVPGETLRVEVSTTTAPNRVKVVTEFGIAETETHI